MVDRDLEKKIKEGQRRQHPRFRMNLPVTIQDGDHSAVTHTAITRNLSELGLSVDLRSALADGEHMIIRISAPFAQENPTIVAHGRVAWKKAGPRGFTYGIQFILFLGDGGNRLKRYLDSLSKPYL